MTASPESVRSRDRRHVWHTWSPLSADRARLMFSHGDGYRIWDVDGREFIDGLSLGATCGYSHPDVARAVSEQISQLHGVDLSVASHELAGLLAERLSSYLPETLSKTLFVNSGSEGIEAAVLIAAEYWSHVGEPRSRVVTFTRGYHGSTVISRSLSGLPRVGHPFQSPLPVTFVDLPVSPRDLRRPESLPLLLEAFRNALEEDASAQPSAVVVEPFLNVGGGVVLPYGFLRGLRELCDTYGALLILDEVFTAYGRAGRMFACHREAVEPDILVSSKGLSGGYVPIAAVTVQRHIHDTFENEPLIGGLRYGHTTSGHAVGCAAALATLDVLEKESLPERAEHFGGLLVDRLGGLAGIGDVVDVRRFGLVLVVEMCSADAASRAVARAEDKGLLLRQLGDTMMAVPALTIGDEGITAIADRIEYAVAAARAG
ncbi:MAG: aspartate aminotransferase family protein [Acidimicrobiales bacterium]